MVTKYDLVTAMLRDEAKSVVRTTAEYMRFLDTAANMYKYNFREQLLIYAQKPNAKACAEVETWNRLGRWVNKGTKGIALINDRSPITKLRYVFDISNTNSRQGIEVNLWKMKPEYEEQVISSLENSFGVIERDREFQMNIIEIAANVVNDNLTDYLLMLNNVDDGSIITTNDEKAGDFAELVIRSVAYIVMKRCHYSTKEFFEWSDFHTAMQFNSFATLNILGDAVSDISEMTLREIESTVKNLDREAKRQNRTFANSEQIVDNKDRKQTEVKENEIYDITVQTGRRLFVTEPEPARSTEDREIWNAATLIPAQSQESHIRSFVDDRPVEQPSGTDRQTSKRDDGKSDETDERVTGSDGEPERNRPDEMGADDEQHQSTSRGDSSEGTDLRIEQLPSEEKQKNKIAEAESEKLSAFSITQEDVDNILIGGSNFSQGKMRIYEQFLKQQTKEENATFLKKEYGTGGTYPALLYKKISEDHDAKGLNIRAGNIVTPDDERLLKWTDVAKRIAELITADRYLNSAEKEQFPIYLAEKEERLERGKITNRLKEIIYGFTDYQKELGVETNLNRYFISGCIAAFYSNEKKAYELTSDGNFILPALKQELEKVINSDTHFSDRAKELLNEISAEKYKYFEPDYDELNPPPPTPKEYMIPLGSTVYLGLLEYELLEYGEKVVRLYDPQFPILNKEIPRTEFDEKIKENPLNNKYLVEVKEEKAEQPDISEQIQQLYTAPENELREITIHKVNDFYEVYGKEAELITDILNLHLTQKDINGVSTAMCGFPASKLDEYVENISEIGIAVRYADEILVEINKQETELTPPAPVQIKPVKKTNIICPEIPTEKRNNFVIKDNDLGVGTPKERYQNNIAAIKLLKQLESENRLATPQEQEILSKYVGWGGLANSFEEENSNYLELKSLLTDEEYSAARESTLSAYYTPPIVIKSIYKALENMNFKTGNVLEPSCGVGNFMGLLPESMNTSKLYGVELDSISGRIAQQLYQKESIVVQGFEDTNLPDSFFDLAIGNVPFGQFKLADKRYDKHNFLIHDFFFAKTLDKVRPGGIVAFITSKGTMDKENPAVRKYIAQRADLLGAIRLPNNTFKSAAGTEVTSDIIFLQKRDRLVDIEPEWVHLNTTEDGIRMNQYFVENPDMIMGDMQMVTGPYGMQAECIADESVSLEEQLDTAIQNIHAEITEYEFDEVQEDDKILPADPSVRNFSYTVVDGLLYFRENSVMKPVDVSITGQNRIKGLIEIRDCVRTLIEFQTEDYPDEDIKSQQTKLNTLYDDFVDKYGYINSRANSSAFSSDSAYFLLSSLEIFDDDGNFKRKADMFTKRTIRKNIVVSRVDTASEALALSLAERTFVDMEYMSQLTGKSEDELYEDLKGVIFLNPLYEEGNHPESMYLTADEYLSGNVRQKLQVAKMKAEQDTDFRINLEYLEKVQPVPLSASEISVRLGTTWLPTEVIDTFIYELFSTPYYARYRVKSHYSQYTGEWNIEGKSYDAGNVKAYNTYGTDRINGYKIVEQTLNLKDVRIFDYFEDDDGKRKAVLNKKETAIAQGKQELIKQAFQDWIWKDPKRREYLVNMYNEKFNSTRPREYDGSHLNFVGMNPEITLRKHQVNAIAHILYGGNTLLAHVVGGGKTFEMVAAAQESKRLGLCSKSLFVVPNHLTEQWAAEYLQLYPSANILVATKKDFEAKNRKKFCGRIATGDYDAIIIGHSQFEKIPMSVERQIKILRQQMNDVINGITELKQRSGDKFSIKQLEKAKKSIKTKLDKLNDQSRKDDVVSFEELGVDRLFVDEAHYYKNRAKRCDTTCA